MFEQILQEIRNHDTVIIHRHKTPDGDAMGSQIGLKHILKDNFPEKKIFVVGDPAGHYSFMDDCLMDEISDEVYADALAIVLDCGSAHLVSDERYAAAHRTARMDHHIFAGQFCDAEVIDTGYESCCGLVTEFAVESGLALSPVSAKALYTGMTTDSGRFR